jgi:transcriptional regulator GlxA family with amidase domain
MARVLPARCVASHAPSAAPEPARVLDVVVLLLPGGYASTAIAPIEVFHSAGLLWNALRGDAARPRFRVEVASIDGGEVTSPYALALRPSRSIEDIERADLIVVPASGLDVQDHIARNSALLPWLRAWHARGAYIAGICTGVAFLAESGLLDGRRATSHWAVAERLRARYPKVNWQPEFFVTEDERLLCSGGVYASIDLSLYLVEKFCGHEIALQCAKALLVSMPRACQSGYSVLRLSRPHADEKIRQAEAYLQQRYNRDVSIATLAELVGMSPRNFIRRFKAATGHLPGAYSQMLRIAAAKEMLETGATSIQTVCSGIGYEDVAYFRNVFKRHTGMTPGAYRSHFAGMSIARGEPAAGNGENPAPVRHAS